MFGSVLTNLQCLNVFLWHERGHIVTAGEKMADIAKE